MFTTTNPQVSAFTAPSESASGGAEVRPPRARLRLLAAVAPVLAIFLVQVPALLVSLVLPVTESSPAARVVASVVAQSVVVAATTVALVAGLARLHGSSLREVGWRWTRASGRALALGTVIAAPMVLAIGFALTRADVLREAPQSSLPLWGVVIGGLAQAWLLQGMPEELLFRGYQMAAWRVRPVVAVLLSAAVFTLPHLASRGGQESALERVLYLAVPFGMGVLAGGLVVLTRSVWAAVGTHAGWHTGLLVAQIAGFGTGPLFWVACGAVATTIGAAVLVVAHRRALPTIWTGPTR